MALLQANISTRCNKDGTGFISIYSISVESQSQVYVLIYSATLSFARTFPPNLLPDVVSLLPSDTYSVECWQNGEQGTVKINGTVYTTATLVIDCFNCDLVISNIVTTTAAVPVANGTATITATGINGAKEYSINGLNWQTSNVFNGVSAGNYNAYVRYKAKTTCIASKPFAIKPDPRYGCTNPDADNYNPDATVDNGTCVFNPKYYATGGTMPNPIWIEKTYSPTTGFPAKLKTRHYITLNLYLGGSNILIASKVARVRNGKIKVDISKDLQRGLLNLSVGNGLISNDAEAIFPFEIGIIESFDGKSIAESRLPYPKRNAIRVALPKAADTIISNVLQQIPNQESASQADFLTAFDVPVKFANEPVCLAILIDDSAYYNGSVYNPLYLERSYFDSQNRLVQRISDQVFQTGFVRFEINDPVLYCVSYMEVCLNTAFREQNADCYEGEVVPPEVLPKVVQIRDGAGNVIANVPAGSAFIIESGFSFGFRIVEQ